MCAGMHHIAEGNVQCASLPPTRFFFCRFSVATVIYVTLIESSSYDCARQVIPFLSFARINMMLELVSGLGQTTLG